MNAAICCTLKITNLNYYKEMDTRPVFDAFASITEV